MVEMQFVPTPREALVVLANQDSLAIQGSIAMTSMSVPLTRLFVAGKPVAKMWQALTLVPVSMVLPLTLPPEVVEVLWPAPVMTSVLEMPSAQVEPVTAQNPT